MALCFLTWMRYLRYFTAALLLILVLDPRLTVRHGGDHLPRRVVLSQTLDLPEEAHLWNVSEVPTIVATQRGAKRSFQRLLASKGVEVVEFDILDPRDVMGYLYDRGYLSVLWECGGTLAASAISSGVIHKVYPHNLFLLFILDLLLSCYYFSGGYVLFS